MHALHCLKGLCLSTFTSFKQSPLSAQNQPLTSLMLHCYWKQHFESPMDDPKPRNAIISNSCSGCEPLTLEGFMSCASISVRENHSGMGIFEHIRSLKKSARLVLNVKQMKQSMDQCTLCRMIYTEIRGAIPADAHVVSVFKVEDLDHRISGVWLYHGFEKYSVAKLCCYADKGTEKHFYARQVL